MSKCSVVVRSPRGGAWVVAILCLCGAAAGQQSLTTTVNSSGPTGSNHAAAHGLRTGTGVNIGIIEVPESNGRNGIIGNGNLGARLLNSWNFNGLAPGFIGPIPAPTGNGDHATMVSSLAAGNAIAAAAPYPGMVGVARQANVYFANIAGVGAAGYTNSLRLATSYMRLNGGTHLFNHSWGYTGSDDGGQNPDAVYMDWFQNRYDGLMMVAAGNDGHVAAGGGVYNNGTKIMGRPADLYNGITVGATDQTFSMRGTYSSYLATGENGITTNGRGKPDIVAPGTGMDDTIAYPGNRPTFGTSWATPHVTGAAALLVQNGLGLGGGPGGGARPPSNHTAIKALILNSARKRGIAGENSANSTARDYTGGFSNVTRTDQETSDEDYLNGAATLRVGGTPVNGAPPNATANWTPTQWAKNPGPTGAFFAYKPLDDEQGTGLLDAHRALINMNGGEQNPGNITPIGWDRDSVQSVAGQVRKSYDVNFVIPANSFITATLCWDRLITETNDGGPNTALDQVDLNDTYGPTGGAAVNGLADLDLEFNYHGAQGNFLLAGSVSVIDNVEHLHIPTPFVINPGELSIDVKLTNDRGLGVIDYGVAWWTVPTPGVSSLLAMAGIVAMRRRRS